MTGPGAVSSLHRYPVKSMTGEALEVLDLDDRGVVGDRVWAVRTESGRIGSGKRTRRFERVDGLLAVRGRAGERDPVVTLPSGESFTVTDPAADARLSEHLGREIRLLRETTVDHFDDGPVSLLGLASVDALAAELGAEVDPGRFRANIVVAGWPAYAEDSLVGRTLRLGEVVLQVTMRSPRCVMVDMESADLPAQAGVLRAAGRANEACLGVVARVVRPGAVERGSAVELIHP